MLIVALSASLYGAHLRALERQEKAFQELSRKGFTIEVYGDGAYLQTRNDGSVRGTGLARVIERQADNLFAQEDEQLLEEVIALKVVNVAGLRLPEERVAELSARFPNTIIFNGHKGK